MHFKTLTGSSVYRFCVWHINSNAGKKPNKKLSSGEVIVKVAQPCFFGLRIFLCKCIKSVMIAVFVCLGEAFVLRPSSLSRSWTLFCSFPSLQMSGRPLFHLFRLGWACMWRKMKGQTVLHILAYVCLHGELCCVFLSWVFALRPDNWNVSPRACCEKKNRT